MYLLQCQYCKTVIEREFAFKKVTCIDCKTEMRNKRSKKYYKINGSNYVKKKDRKTNLF